MKKIIALICFLFLLSAPVIADGTLHIGNSSPSNLVIYYPKNWSQTGVWDLSQINLSDRAVITKIKVKWNTFSSLVDQQVEGLEIVISNQHGKEAILKNGITDKFNGAQVKQQWKVKYYVKNLKYKGSYFAIVPKLIIYYRL